ncbi:hypothetical protein D3C87_1486470 [compost metagenome]
MRLTPKRRQRLFQAIQRGAGQANHLLAIADKLNARNAQRVDQDDVAVVVIAVWRRAPGQPRVGRLHDDDAAGLHHGLQHAPLFQQRARPHHGKDFAFAGAMAPAKAARGRIAGQYMGGADHGAQLRQQGGALGHVGRKRHGSGGVA